MKTKLKRAVIGVFIIVIVIMLIIVIKPFSKHKKGVEVKKPFSTLKEWIKEENKTKIIDVETATSNQALYLMGQEHLIGERGDIVVFYNLFYKGNYAKNYYESNGKRVFYVGNNFNSSVPSVFAIFKYEEAKLVSYVFVNDAFIAAYGTPNIIVVSDITTKHNIIQHKFQASNKIGDINVMKIDDDFSWLLTNPVKGRMFIGTITKQDIIEGNYNNSVFVMIN